MPRADYVARDERLQAVWQLLEAHQGESFTTAKGLPFCYVIRGGELFVDRRSKSITISTVGAALRHIDALLAQGESITGPKMIGCYGASYLYPVFLRLGVFPAPDTQLQMGDYLPPGT